MTALDIGARGGFKGDLFPIAWAVDTVGFEPDADECARLNRDAAASRSRWRSVRFLPTALAGSTGERTLHLTRHRGTSSMLEPLPRIGEKFSRPDYFAIDGTVNMATMTLDDAIKQLHLDEPAHLKIDVEGLEKEIFEAAPTTMAGVLAVRTETSFLRTRKDQPLFGDVDDCLVKYGFVAMGFEELHHWRRSSVVQHPKIARGPIPYSKGQLAHGDMLYLRDPDDMPGRTKADVRRLLALGFLSLCYDHVDHAAAALTKPEVSQHLETEYGLDPMTELGVVSRTLVSRYRRRRARGIWADFKNATARRLGLRHS